MYLVKCDKIRLNVMLEMGIRAWPDCDILQERGILCSRMGKEITV